MSKQVKQVAIEPLSPAFLPLWEHYKYPDLVNLVLYSGRACGKTTEVCRFSDFVCNNSKARIVFSRATDVALDKTIYTAFKDYTISIGTYGNYDFIPSKSLIVNKLTGADIHFIGLNADPEKIKGTPNITYHISDECTALTLEAIDKSIPTVIRGSSDEYHLNIWLFNPEFETDPIYQRVVKNADGVTTLCVKLTQDDNPMLPESTKKLMEYDYRTDPETALWVWGGEFRGVSIGTLIPLESIELCVGMPMDKQPYQTFAGLDIGATGDPSVCYIRQGRRFVAVESWQEADHSVLLDKVCAFLTAHSVDMVMPDATGFGYTFSQNLQKAYGSSRVLPVNFSGSASTMGFANKRAEMATKVRDAIIAGVSLPVNYELIEELKVIRAFKTKTGLSQLEGKEDLRKRLGRSTNYLDAIMLSYAIPDRPVTNSVTNRNKNAILRQTRWAN